MLVNSMSTSLSLSQRKFIGQMKGFSSIFIRTFGVVPQAINSSRYRRAISASVSTEGQEIRLARLRLKILAVK